MPTDKPLGLDGSTGVFFNKFTNLQVAHLQWLNSTNIVLLPKKEGVEGISEYRPYSLIHAIRKTIAKMIATRFTPYMKKLVSNMQIISLGRGASMIKKK
jgi:hypothetical protein